jgi:hypothetical protein
MKTLVAMLLLTLPCLADEVVLKSGVRVEFRSVEDTGDTYTIVTPEGGRVVVKRADVDGFAKTEPAAALTGASFTFDKKTKLDAVDLLKRIDTGRDVLDGTWKFGPGGILTGSTAVDARIQIPYMPAVDEYDLTLVLERVEGDDNVGVGLPTSTGLCGFHIDIDRGAYSGILAPDGAGHRKVSSTPGKQLAVGKPRTFTFMVRKTGLVVRVDGKDLSATRLDWSRSAMLPQCAPSSREAFSIYALKSTIRISRMTLTVPK